MITNLCLTMAIASYLQLHPKSSTTIAIMEMMERPAVSQCILFQDNIDDPRSAIKCC